MKRPISLTLRLTLLFSAVAVIVFLAFGWIIERSINEHFELEDGKELRVVAQAVERALATLDSEHKLDELTRVKKRFTDILVGHHGPLLYVRDGAGNTLFSSLEADLSLVPVPHFEQRSEASIQQWNDEKHHYRVLTQKFSGGRGGSYTIVIAVAIDFHQQFLQQFRYTLWLMIFSGIFIMGLLGWIAVRRGHRPLHRIVAQISQTSANELNIHLDQETVPVELTELADSFNELLKRLEESFSRLSNFSADIAHELRTPVTNLMTQTQVALSQTRSVEEYQEILYSNIEEYERMAQMIGDMLFLAKADNARYPIETEAIDLKSEVNNLLDYYGAWAEESGVILFQQGEAHAKADQLMLRRALSNLLSNAIRHTAPGGCVEVKLGYVNGDVVIVVQNPGAPIPTEHLSKIFDRFYRTDPSRQRSGEGAGLGLAIVKSIVEAHGGTIVAISDEMAVKFEITLPALLTKQSTG